MRRRPLLIGGVAALILAPAHTWAEAMAAEVAQNDRVRRRLRRAGDDGRAPRPVIHAMHPLAGGAPVAQVQRALEDLALEVEPDRGGGLRARHVVPVRGAEFDTFTSTLVRLMGANNWQYDGWETSAVQKPKERSN